MFGQQIHRYFYLLGIALIAISLPFSPFFLSLGQIIIAVNWLLEFRFKEKLQAIKNTPSILLFAGIYFVHVIWLLNTKNIEYAFLHDLKIKLPLLSLPLIIGTTKALSTREFKAIIHLYLGAVFTSTIISAAIYLGIAGNEIVDNRNISIFISHIRFSLMLNLAIFFIVGLLVIQNQLKLAHAVFYIISALWSVTFLIFMGAFSGVVILLLTIPILLIYWSKSQENNAIKRFSNITIVVTTILLVSYFGLSIARFLSREEIEIENLPEYTLNGNKYQHYSNTLFYENSHRIWILVCDKELKEQWNLRSTLDYNGKDLKGQNLRPTLIRYLASYGYTRDSVGVSLLTEKDIGMVEKGYSNYLYMRKWALYPRLYQLFWEIENYFKVGDPSGHSLSQRFELVKNGVNVWQRFFFFGTGTGDINDEVQKQFKIDNSVLRSEWQFRPHNQYITFLATFGIFGFSLILLLTYIAIRRLKSNIDFIFIAFLAISLFSMLSEDTLETQAGVTFFSFFLSLLLLSRDSTTTLK